ncbi:hypothetical protein ACO0K3_04710 [Undibacterium sp. Rencai35W]|uniref:hypothetical protein n=1 Tax=Undibacterium sp. Rencai35W TaxID=3413046 RepID=UPI003BEFD5D6
MKSIKFKRHYRCYNPGETAHFSIDIADKLITAGVADEVSATANIASGADEEQSGKVIRKAQPKAANAQPD